MLIIKTRLVSEITIAMPDGTPIRIVVRRGPHGLGIDAPGCKIAWTNEPATPPRPLSPPPIRRTR